VAAVDEGDRMLGHLFIDGFHALVGEGLLDPLSAFAVRPAVQHASGSEALLELRVLRIVRVFRLFLRIKVIEVAEELVEAVRRRQELVLVAQMVLAELAGRGAQRLQQVRDGRVCRPETDVGSGHATLVRPVRIGFCPVMNAARPALKLSIDDIADPLDSGLPDSDKFLISVRLSDRTRSGRTPRAAR
jgi:hypothetical protein